MDKLLYYVIAIFLIISAVVFSAVAIKALINFIVFIAAAVIMTSGAKVMNNNILRAIESLCDDLATNTNAKDNQKRANACLLYTSL